MSKRYPVITTLDMPEKAEVYNFTLPADTKSYTIKPRGNTEFKIAFAADGIEQGNFLTIPSGNAETEENLNREDSITIWVQAEKDSETLEIKRWR